MRARTIAVAAGAALALSGCGGGRSATTAKPPAGRNVDPVPGERIGDVVSRVEGAVTASSCTPVKGLLHSVYGTISDAACRSVRVELGAFGAPRAKAYGTGAAIEYSAIGDRRKLMALALDSDRRFHLAFIRDLSSPAIGTARPPEFDAAASTVLRAMRTGDCTTFLRYVDRSSGLGTGGDEQVCSRVSDEPFRRELVANPGATAVPLGGNSQIAFYKLRTAPMRYYTMVMVHAPASRSSTGYLLVNAFPA